MSIDLHTAVLQSGERFPVLVDKTGIPLQFPLAFSLRDRERGGVARLKDRLRRIRELYDAFTAMGKDLDHSILTRSVDPMDAETAIYWTEEETDGQVSASMRNARVRTWTDFLGWAVETSRWTQRSRPNADFTERAAAQRIALLLEDLRLPMASSSEVYPFTGRELDVLEDVLGPGPRGDFPVSPLRGMAALRTWVLYEIQRWGGLRLGEALKLQIGDIPPRETDVARELRLVTDGALSISVVRRVDDPQDPRHNEPSVKRFGRSVPLPDSLFDLIWQYVDALPSATPYLIRTDCGTRPLSYSQASKLAYLVRPAAARLFERRFPGDPHTLNTFRWHRLRHTCAVEMLPVFVGENPQSPQGIGQFCAMFGWANPTSADPYVRLVFRRDGEAVWHNYLERLTP